MNHTSFGLKRFTKNRVNPFEGNFSNKLPENGDSEGVQISKQYLSKIFGLSRTGIRLLSYFISNQSSNSNTVYFNLRECELNCGLNNKRSIYNGLIELLGEEIIARSNNENIYFLNTDIIKCIK